jgi:hypothetical protein
MSGFDDHIGVAAACHQYGLCVWLVHFGLKFSSAKIQMFL